MRRVLFLIVTLALVSPATAADKSDKSDVLRQVDQKEAAGDHAGALALLRSAAAAPGAGGELGLRLGRMLEAGNDVDAAIDAYKAAAGNLSAAAKGEALARLALLQEVRVVGDPAATAQEAGAADPEGAWPKVALARARARQKKADEAKTLAEAASTAGAAATAALAFALEAKPDLAAAEASYKKALAEDAGRMEATIGLARVLRKTGRAAEAEPLLRTLVAAAPVAALAFEESARVKAALGRANEASADALVAATLAEGDNDARRLVNEMAAEKAIADARKGEIDFAIRRLTALHQEDPKSAELMIGLSKIHVLKRDAAAAEADLVDALADAPDSAEAHDQLGYVRHALKQDANAALPEFEKAVALAPDNLEYRAHLGAVLSELQQFTRAETELLKVTADPGYTKADAWVYLGGAYLNAKKYDNAVAALQKALALAPQETMANAYIAWSYFGLKDAENFKKYGAKARSLGYKDPRFLQNLTRVEGGEAIK